MLDEASSVDSDEPTDLENLFGSRDEEDDVFYFRQIRLHKGHCHDRGMKFTQVQFVYNYANEFDIVSSLYIPYHIDEGDESHLHCVFCIGMCVLTWYWMGFATKNIVVEIKSIESNSSSVLHFWEHFYNEVLLEFQYTNKLTEPIKILYESAASKESIAVSDCLLFELPQQMDKYTATDDLDYQSMTLCPLGGGKDSLVVWRDTKESQRNPLWMYVSDGMHEFQVSTRLPNIVDTSGTQMLLMRHDFFSRDFEKYARSYRNPCGHPWAALVLFDACLVSYPVIEVYIYIYIYVCMDR
jgi:hypothetical protein